MEDYLKQHPVDGSVAVRAWKQGSKLTGWSLTNLAGRLGGLLHDSGCPIDLESPDHVLALISDGPSASLACGWMEGDGQASFSNGERRAVNARSSNRSALTRCWPDLPSTWQRVL